MNDYFICPFVTGAFLQYKTGWKLRAPGESNQFIHLDSKLCSVQLQCKCSTIGYKTVFATAYLQSSSRSQHHIECSVIAIVIIWWQQNKSSHRIVTTHHFQSLVTKANSKEVTSYAKLAATKLRQVFLVFPKITCIAGWTSEIVSQGMAHHRFCNCHGNAQ